MSTFLMSGVVVTAGLMLFLQSRFRRALRDAARELKLVWRDPGGLAPGSFEGEVEGELVHVTTERDADGDVRSIVLAAEIRFPVPFPVEFAAAEESLLDRLGFIVGLSDHMFDDPAFDQRFRVRGEDPDALRRLFNPAARLALVALAKSASDVHVSPSRLRWWHEGRVYDGHALAREVRQAVVAAKAMRHATDP